MTLERLNIFFHDQKVLISSATFYQVQLQIVWYVLSELWEETTFCHHVIVCVFYSSTSAFYIYLTLNFFLFYWLIFLAVCLYVTQRVFGLSVILCLFSEKHIGCLCYPFLCRPKPLEAPALGGHVKNTSVCLYRLCVFAREYALISFSVNLCI